MSFPELASAAVGVLVSRRLLRSNRDARRRLVPFANRNLARAEQQFASQFALRGFDQQVYEYIRNLPKYKPCIDAVHRGYRTGAMASSNQVKQSAFSFSRYNCGAREEAINSALSAGLIAGGEIGSGAGNFEDTLEIAYEQMRWTSIANSSRFAPANASRAFSDTGQSLIRQADTFNTQAVGAATALGTATGTLFNRFRDRNIQDSQTDLGQQIISRRELTPTELRNFSTVA